MITPSTTNYKQDYDQYVIKATQMVHTPQVSDSILQLLTGPDPVQHIADASVMIMQRLDAAARTAGVEVQDTIKAYGAAKIVELVIEVGEAAGKFKMNPDLTQLALSVAIQDYTKSEIKAGRINPIKAKVGMEADIRKMPPKLRKESQQAQAKIQQTARRYNHGQGMTGQQPQPTGMIATAPQTTQE